MRIAFNLKAMYISTVLREATFDSSFWVHVAYMDLVAFLLEDYHLRCPSAVEDEFSRKNPTGLLLKTLLSEGRILRLEPEKETLKLYGNGERAAINLAIERKLLLCIDDWRPSEAAQGAGVETLSSVAFLIKLYRKDRLPIERVLAELARMSRRGTLRAEWIHAAMRLAAEIKQE